jgi:pimeloyl-ACP methyl ester carboxylesterase
MASLVQDFWLGASPRLRGRRLAPYDEPAVRVVFHLDVGLTLDTPEAAAFLEALGARVDVVAFEPRGQGGSGGWFGPEAVADLRDLLASAPRRWRDGLPLVVGGHGLGAAVALAVAGETDARAVVALSPRVADFLSAAELAPRVRSLTGPVLFVAPRGEQDVALELASGQPGASLLLVPGDHLAPLRSPWVEAVAEWARHPS